MDFYSNDNRVYIDPVKEIVNYRKKANLDNWPTKLIYQPFPMPKIRHEIGLLEKELPLLYAGCHLDLLKENILYCQGLMGAPATCILLEELIALGVQEIFFLGLAGSLVPSLSIGERLVVNRAKRLEGTSYHYLTAEKPAKPSTYLMEWFREYLKKANIRYREGSICSTDAPFRETWALIENLKQDNILAIEMEVAAFYSLCHYRNVQSTAMVIISDQLLDNHWTGIKRKDVTDTFRASINLVHNFFLSR